MILKLTLLLHITSAGTWCSQDVLFYYSDRLRTTSSVVGHTMAAAVTHHFCRRELEKNTQDENVGDIDVDIIVEHERLIRSQETGQSTV